MTEEWRSVARNPRYQVSSLGRVRSVGREGARGRWVPTKILSPGRSSSGYLTVSLGRGNSVGVHVLVCEAWHGEKPFAAAEVRHRDDVRYHNYPHNLRWGSRGENIADKKWNGREYKLSPVEVSAIKSALQRGVSGAELASAFDVTQACISAIKMGYFHRDVI